jgi:hypothetical protein
MTERHGYITLAAGDLADDLADLPTVRLHPLPEIPHERPPGPDAGTLAAILERLRSL